MTAFDNLNKAQLVEALGEYYAKCVQKGERIAALERQVDQMANSISDLYEERVDMLKRVEQTNDQEMARLLGQRVCRNCGSSAHCEIADAAAARHGFGCNYFREV